MPQRTFSLSVPAGGTAEPLAGWQYEYLPWPALIVLLIRATATGVRMVITSGSETIVEEAPVASGGTAGQIPTIFNVPEISWEGAAGDRLKVLVRNTGGAAANVDGQITVEPLL